MSQLLAVPHDLVEDRRCSARDMNNEKLRKYYHLAKELQERLPEEIVGTHFDHEDSLEEVENKEEALSHYGGMLERLRDDLVNIIQKTLNELTVKEANERGIKMSG